MGFRSLIRLLFCQSPASSRKVEQERTRRRNRYKHVHEGHNRRRNEGSDTSYRQRVEPGDICRQEGGSGNLPQQSEYRISLPSRRRTLATEAHRPVREHLPTPPPDDLPQTSPEQTITPTRSQRMRQTRNTRNHPLPPTPPQSPLEASPSREAMSRNTVKEVIDIIGKAFSHCPYAVTGLAAMVYFGFRHRWPKRVSIHCPQDSQGAIRCWAIAQGMQKIHGDPNAFGILTSDQKLRIVKIKFVATGFQNLCILREGPYNSRIIGLPTIAAQIAEGYVRDLATVSERRQNLYASDMRWALRMMIRKGERLTRDNACKIISRDFWLPFTLSFPDTVPLFAEVGVASSAWQPHLSDEAQYLDEAAETSHTSQQRGGSAVSTATCRGSFSSLEDLRGPSSNSHTNSETTGLTAPSRFTATPIGVGSCSRPKRRRSPLGL